MEDGGDSDAGKPLEWWKPPVKSEAAVASEDDVDVDDMPILPPPPLLDDVDVGLER